MAVKILIVDDHQIIRQGLKLLLAQEPDFEVVGEAADGHEAVAEAERLTPDVVLMDVNMPAMNGIEATRIIKQQHPAVKVIVLSMFDDQHFINAMQQVGASGYVVKEAAYELLVSAIREVLDDRQVFPQPRADEGVTTGSDLNVSLYMRDNYEP
jgi:DNA-binding NarL/FixJ family response regulator